MKTRYYIGHKSGSKTVFPSDTIPTAETHPQYNGVTGPFVTKRAALWGCQTGAHWDTIAQAERLALADKGQSELIASEDSRLRAIIAKAQAQNNKR